MSDRCLCAHAREVHLHHRSGTDCGLCACPRFRERPPLTERLFAFLHALIWG